MNRLPNDASWATIRAHGKGLGLRVADRIRSVYPSNEGDPRSEPDGLRIEGKDFPKNKREEAIAFVNSCLEREAAGERTPANE